MSLSLILPEAGKGPGLVVCHELPATDARVREIAQLFAEEGYVVVVAEGEIEAAVKELRANPACEGKIGALGYGAGGKRALLAAARSQVDCAVSYVGTGVEAIATEVPVVLHVTGRIGEVRGNVEVYEYPSFDKAAAGMAHSRTIALLRRVLGPNYDLNALWEQHLACEFTTRDVDANMKTMVAQPYVNHIPTITGGIGHELLKRFYKYHFIDKFPKDRQKTPISRTIGADRIVDEGVLTFTHDEEIDWLLPGVPPTGKKVSIAIVAVVCFRGDKIYHEHIYWDQASVLVQVGLLDPKGLPVAGAESARKALDETLPSNTLMPGWKESAGLPLS
jgi:carboxymethylenebutenolidase